MKPCLNHYPARRTGCPECERIVSAGERSFRPTPKRAGDLVMVGSGPRAKFVRVA